ncbi:YMGG-like glycine zipper-containing protein [Pelagibius sp.]|uniref:YMGG-like glycine zipper-containing protein n=1 Tax=Pelagibius sp. TaxID=1931238 RepID=UPI00262AB92A|nr:YMGG-like glycine zipper-containing protein [Pelagibius sp.]
MLATSLALSACGSSTGDRGLSGAGIGAGAGAVVGAVTGLTVVEGALIGAAAGGLTGVLTDEDDIDLGKPLWD